MCFAGLILALSACGDPIQIVNTTADVGGPDVSTDVGGPVSCSTDSDCPAQLECQVPTCDGGVCAYPIAADKCLVDGICYNAGATLASDQCKLCDPSATQEGLVNKECAANETCNPSGGICESDNPLAAQCGACVDNTGCEAGLSCTALGGGAGKFCIKTCTDSAECGDGFACAEVDGASLCVLSTCLLYTSPSPRDS